MINVDVSVMNVCEIDYVQNPATCNCENGKYLAGISDNSVITCDEIIDADAKANDEANPNDDKTKTNFNEKKQSVKLKIAIFCLHFY